MNCSIVVTDNTILYTNVIPLYLYIDILINARFIEIRSINDDDRISFENILSLDNCQILICNNMKLNKLPNLPQCQELICTNNYLQMLPPLPNCRILLCNENYLSSIPSLPECHAVNCDTNIIRTINNLPKCEIIYCGFNIIKSITNIPVCHSLACQNNHLQYLPSLPLCDKLYAWSNNLKKLPNNINNIKTMIVKQNSNLYYNKSHSSKYFLPYPSPGHSRKMKLYWNKLFIFSYFIVQLNKINISGDLKLNILSFLFSLSGNKNYYNIIKTYF